MMDTPRKQRSAAAGIDYREVTSVPSMDTPPTNDGASGKKHANRHVHRILSDTSTFQKPESIIQTVTDGSTLTSSALLDPNNPLTIHRPILVTDTPESIGMKVPRGPPMTRSPTRKNADGNGNNDQPPAAAVQRKRISIREIGELVGMMEPVIVMDVRTQEELEGWMMSDLVDYFEDEERLFLDGQDERKAAADAATLQEGSANGAGWSAATTTATSGRPSSSRTAPARRAAASKTSAPGGSNRPPPRVLNQISLEFSHTPLIKRTRSPRFVRDIDWIDNLWPAIHKKVGDYPVVQYYCLTSTAGCYTDFHEDFGGTSVWYSVLSGAKIFLLAPPTETNLKLYEAWLCRQDHAKVFFPDMEGVENVVKVTLKQDQTLLIPSGWIHSVYTPVDSIVVGGNFLHGLAISTQLDIHCIETRTRVPAKFRFPHFQRMMFYAGVGYLERMRSGKVHAEELKGMRRFAEALRSWGVTPGGDADRPLSNAGTAAECAKRVGCANVGDMVEKILSELDRIERDGIVPLPRSPAAPKLKLSLKNIESPSVSPPPPSSAEATPGAIKPKIKLKLGNLGAMLKEEEEEPGSAEPRSAESDDLFRINVPSSASTVSMVKKRKVPTISDLDSRHAKVDAGDEEWTPGTEDAVQYRSKPKLTLSSPPRSPKGRPKKAARAVIPKARPAPKAKKVMSARERLKKKMKF